MVDSLMRELAPRRFGLSPTSVERKLFEHKLSLIRPLMSMPPCHRVYSNPCWLNGKVIGQNHHQPLLVALSARARIVRACGPCETRPSRLAGASRIFAINPRTCCPATVGTDFRSEKPTFTPKGPVFLICCWRANNQAPPRSKAPFWRPWKEPGDLGDEFLLPDRSWCWPQNRWSRSTFLPEAQMDRFSLQTPGGLPRTRRVEVLRRADGNRQ